MRLTLKPHPDTPCEPVSEAWVEVIRHDRQLFFVTFNLLGDLDEVRFPAQAAAGRADELWKHTCFEAFVGAEGDERYYEFNFSPSGEWAAYCFDGYRRGMADVADIRLPPFDFELGHWQGEFCARPELAALDDLPEDLPWRLGLSAVIELKDGSKSYWALNHAPGKPDFHHPDAFAATLPARTL